MIQKVEQPYFEMGFNLLAGIVVDAELKDQIEAVLCEARAKVGSLIMNNLQHIKETNSNLVYPRGKQTSFNIAEPKREYDMDLGRRMYLLNGALSMKRVEHLFETDERLNDDKIKAFVQRAIEDDLDREEAGHE
jgi:hypothetical protein